MESHAMCNLGNPFASRLLSDSIAEANLATGLWLCLNWPMLHTADAEARKPLGRSMYTMWLRNSYITI